MAMHISKLFLLGLLCIALVLSSGEKLGATGNIAGEICIGGPCQDCGRRCLIWGFQKGGCNLSSLCCCSDPF
ncbi:unnamed protein product [Lathyrus oleraceus]